MTVDMLLVIERMKEFGADAPIVLVGDHNCLEFTIPATRPGKKLFPSDHFPTVATLVFKLT